MKKLLLIVIMFVIATFYIIDDKNHLSNYKKEENSFSEFCALYFSYIEFEEYIMNEDDNGAKKNIDTIVSNMKSDKFNLLILHVRPFSDSIYPSKVFPTSKYIGNVSVDV